VSPKVEELQLFAAPTGGGNAPHPALAVADWPAYRFRVLEELTRPNIETIVDSRGVERKVKRTNRYLVADLIVRAKVTAEEASKALDYFERLKLAREVKRADGRGPLPSQWVVTAAGKREYARVRPLMARSDCAQ
jgi:hypothetical protein